ncbi:MAG: DUF2336 domain-containing protein [Caulobacteraceae bacterium]
MTTTATRIALTEADIRALVRGSSIDERATAAHKLCRRIDAGLSEGDQGAATEVLRLMALDAAELVRRALAVTLKMSKALPRDIALLLARDVESVATPVLNFSPAFTDEDLAQIVEVSDDLKQLAVARRAVLSETVTSALVRHGSEQAVRAACANDNAAFSEASLKTAVDRFTDSQAIAVAMAYRKALPISISERLVAIVSDRVRQHLVDHHGVSAETALDVALGVQERATIDLVDQAGRASDLKAFTAHLHRQGRLTPSLLLRTLAHGHIDFLEWGLAELSGVPHHRTWLLIHDAGALGFLTIYQRAGLPEGLFSAFRIGLDTYHALMIEGMEMDRSRFQQRMLERFLTQDEAEDQEEVDYLLDRMDDLSEDGLAPASAAAYDRGGEPRFAFLD